MHYIGSLPRFAAGILDNRDREVTNPKPLTEDLTVFSGGAFVISRGVGLSCSKGFWPKGVFQFQNGVYMMVYLDPKEPTFSRTCI